MLTGVTFWTKDKVWHGILAGLGAIPADKDTADLIFNPAKYAGKLSLLELKSRIMSDIDESRARTVRNACGDAASSVRPPLSPAQVKIITLSTRAGARGIGAESLRAALGYSTDANTHALDTAIYNLRKIFGADFIKTENGKYFIRKP